MCIWCKIVDKTEQITGGDHLYTSVLNWLDEAVDRYPDKIVFTDAQSSVTFREFDALTRSIGSFLAGRVPAGSPIVVMTGRHIVTPACFLGVVRAGCFYAPMDATVPPSRLGQTLDVIRADCMLVDRENLETARTLDFAGEIIVMEDILQTPCDGALLRRAEGTLTDQSPLYVIFTSGSTGIPKGVVTSHHSLMCYIDAVRKVLQVDETDIFGSQSPLDYIAAVRDIYLPIRTGASTVIIPKNEFSMPRQLFERLNAHRVTSLCWSAAGIELLAKLRAFGTSKPKYLKKVCFSGSVMPGKDLKYWQQNLPDVMFVNQYGPTETTASCTYYVVGEEVTDDTVLPIGVPYENYKILLLREDNTQAEAGELGEICVAGPGLTLGYYGNPEKTAETFTQNPLNPNYRELIYRTGDFGRFREDGLLEFHGRKDRQIKHLGHRIELDEIESAAKRIAGIDECCALYDGQKEKLYLFYTGTATAKEIAIYFRSMLPGYMAPGRTVNLDSFPTLPNGKKDMQALKAYFR